MKYVTLLTVLAAVFAFSGCDVEGQRTFGQDVKFLKNHTDAIVLSDQSGNSRVALVPAYQGRVMTSTATGPDGLSFGWTNYDLIESGEIQPHINAFGGEERFWMGPEGGQFAIFFPKGTDEFNLENWQTPAVIDTEPYDLISQTSDTASFRKRTQLTNVSGGEFDIQIDRTVRILPAAEMRKHLGAPVPDSVNSVAYQSDNSITNKGTKPWRKKTGLLSIWMLGMFKHSPSTTVVIPFNPGPESRLGPKVNDTYFGKVPAERLVVEENVLFFSGDGQYRSKIGLSPKRSKPIAGSYDAQNQVLTIVQYTKPAGATDYVNSMWEFQDAPYGGDVINSYNDGPPEPGASPLGPFYELETSSPAAELKPGQTLSHMNRTFHLQGAEADLDPIARATLGVSIDRIKTALAK